MSRNVVTIDREYFVLSFWKLPLYLTFMADKPCHMRLYKQMNNNLCCYFHADNEKYLITKLSQSMVLSVTSTSRKKKFPHASGEGGIKCYIDSSFTASYDIMQYLDYIFFSFPYCRLPSVANLQGYMKDVGFTLGSVIVLTDMIFKPDHWLDKEGPFRQEWRNTDRYGSMHDGLFLVSIITFVQ